MKPILKGFLIFFFVAALIYLITCRVPVSGFLPAMFCVLLAFFTGILVWSLAGSTKYQKLLLKNASVLENEKYFRALVEKSEDAIVLMDEKGNVLYQSPSTEKILGYSLQEIQGMVGLNLIHPDDRTADAFMFAHLVETHGDVMHRQHRLRHKSGQYRWMEGTLMNLLNDPDVNAIVYKYHDVTERVETEEKIASANRLYEFISRINQVIIHVHEEETLFSEACQIAVELGKFRMAWIGMLNAEENRIIPAMSAGMPFNYLSTKLNVALDDEGLRNGTTARAIASGTHVVCNDIENDPVVVPWAKEAFERGNRSCISFPLKKFGKVVGVYTLYSSIVNCFDEKEIALLEEVAGDISFTLENFEKEKMRLLAEEEVVKMYKEKETILNRINDSVVGLDNEWRYTFLNDAAIATHPESREETIGKVIWDVHPGMIGTVFEEKYHEAIQTGKAVQTEGYYPPMKTWFMAKIYPSKDGLTIFYQDITERKKVEEQIALEKTFSESIVNSLPGIFYLYDRNRKFMRWNRNFELISGYTHEQISRMHPLDFFPEEDKAIVERKIENVFNIGNGEVMANFYTRDKRKIPYYFNGHRANFNGVDYLMGMGIDMTDRVKIENELHERTEEIIQLTVHLEQIREEERTRIAREIHDELGQQLTGLKMDVSWINKRIADHDAGVKEKIAVMLALIDDTVKTVRRISSELRPGILDDLGLIPALEWQSQEFEKRSGIKTSFQTDLIDFAPETILATTIFRVYQEALTNIARHAQATQVESGLEQKDNCIVLTVKDNGLGFDAEEIKKKNSLGLVGMRERARLFQGELILEKNMPEGTIIRLKIPIKLT